RRHVGELLARFIGDDEGVFLDVSHRLHPDIGRYISAIAYEDRLRSDDACGQQRLGGGDALSGTGLRFIPVSHKDRKTVSPEEVDVVRAVIRALVDRSWIGRDGRTRSLALPDILVVAPYNAHVNRLIRALPTGARVGTVDRFQGQEAPVVIYTLASSSLEDAPRGPEFLYSLNRLNVAVSRAQGLAVLVASPALLDAKPRTVEQLPLIDALCRFAAGATLIDPATLT
ncbi:MAG: AAA domain-containing protein, partial [Clostridia bacterium]